MTSANAASACRADDERAEPEAVPDPDPDPTPTPAASASSAAAPSSEYRRERGWRPADDVYQVGLLMATLLAGEEFYTGVKKPEINQITRPGKLRDAIKAAISVKAQRPQDAAQLAKMIA